MRPLLIALTACLLLDACALTHRMHRHVAKDATTIAQTLPPLATRDVPVAFVGEPQSSHDLDSITSWLAQDGTTWVIATASKSDQLVVFDGDSGKRLRTIGASGTGPGQFRAPSGIVAYADLVFVVERDNHRVQVLQLPDFKPLGSFGGEQLRSPLALWLHETAPEEYEVLVTDNGPATQQIPPLPQLGQRIKRYRVRTDDGTLHADYVGAFGDTTAAGALRSAEAIAGDDDNGRLAIAEGRHDVGSRLRVYGMGGRYTGTDIGTGQYRARAAGVALFACADGSGYWIGADRDPRRSAFLVFDRKSLAYLGAFAGKDVADTAGIALQPASSKRFPDGALYAVSNGDAIAAFDWGEIAQALALNRDCR